MPTLSLPLIVAKGRLPVNLGADGSSMSNNGPGMLFYSLSSSEPPSSLPPLSAVELSGVIYVWTDSPLSVSITPVNFYGPLVDPSSGSGSGSGSGGSIGLYDGDGNLVEPVRTGWRFPGLVITDDDSSVPPQTVLSAATAPDGMGIEWETADSNVEVSGAQYYTVAGELRLLGTITVFNQSSAQAILDTLSPLFSIPTAFAPVAGLTDPILCIYQDADDGLFRNVPLQAFTAAEMHCLGSYMPGGAPTAGAFGGTFYVGNLKWLL